MVCKMHCDNASGFSIVEKMVYSKQEYHQVKRVERGGEGWSGCVGKGAKSEDRGQEKPSNRRESRLRRRAERM